jgi:hypothetical protein
MVTAALTNRSGARLQLNFHHALEMKPDIAPETAQFRAEGLSLAFT